MKIAGCLLPLLLGCLCLCGPIRAEEKVAEKPAAKLEVKELLAVRLEPVKREGKTYQFEMIVQNISDRHFFLHVEDPVASWGCTSFLSWVGAQAYLDRNEVTSGVPGSFQGMVISPREERRLFVTGEATEDGKIAFKALHTALPVFSADAEISVRLLLNAADYADGVCATGWLESNRVKLEFPFPLCQEDKELYTPEHFQKLQKESPERELPPVPR